MNGIELARSYYETYGEPMLKEEFPELIPLIACGIAGSGSECFGFDDDLSRDHDFEPGFCIFLPDENKVDRRTSFRLERAYAKLPGEFMGVRRSLMQPVGGARRGVIRMDDFFTAKTGRPDGMLTDEEWLSVPEESLAEATNGAVFADGSGELTRIRQHLSFYPEEIRRKKIAGHLLLMAQAGQYNYMRCIGHGEEAAAQLAVCEFVKSAVSVIFLLNREYQPFYKWCFRALRALPELSFEAELFEFLLTSDNRPAMAEEKSKVTEGIAADVIDVLMQQELTKAVCGDLEKHAYSVNDGIADAHLRNLHILAGV